MAKTPKNTSKKVAKKATSKPKKVPYDTSAFNFNTPLEEIKKALERFEKQDLDPMAEPFTKQEIYWWGIWTLQLPEAEKRNLTTVPTCAIENAVLKLPRLVKK